MGLRSPVGSDVRFEAEHNDMRVRSTFAFRLGDPHLFPTYLDTYASLLDCALNADPASLFFNATPAV